MTIRGGDDRGALHLLFLNSDGSIESNLEITDRSTNGPTLSNNDQFGRSIAWRSDREGAGGLLAVGAIGEGNYRGAVHLLKLE